MVTEEFKQLRLATFRSIRPGEIVYFLPEGEAAAPGLPEALADNKYNYTVRIVTSPHKAFNHKAIIKEICLMVPEQVQMRIAPIPPRFASKTTKAISYLFSESDDIFDPREERVVMMDLKRYSESSGEIMYSAVEFMGDEDDFGEIYDEPDEEIWASSKSFIDSDKDPDISIEHALEDEHKEFLRRITELSQQYAVRFHRVPPFAMIEQAVRGRLSLSADQLSPLVVTDDFRIRLPEFNDIEIKMPPLVRIVYLLFLIHPEGIRLKDIADHHQTLLRLYSLVKGRKEFNDVSVRHISDLTDLSDPSSLNQKISRSRWCIDQHVKHHGMTDRYYINGDRGEIYRIDIPSEMIRLPKSLIDLRDTAI